MTAVDGREEFESSYEVNLNKSFLLERFTCIKKIFVSRVRRKKSG